MKEYLLRIEGTMCGRQINPGRVVDEYELKRARKLYAEYKNIEQQLDAIRKAKELMYEKYEHDGELILYEKHEYDGQLVLNFNDELAQMTFETQEQRLFEQREQIQLYFLKLFDFTSSLEIENMTEEEER